MPQDHSAASPPPQWKCVFDQVHCEWMESVQLVFDYFCERTPRSFVEARETSLVWNYKYAGEWAASRLGGVLSEWRREPIFARPQSRTSGGGVTGAPQPAKTSSMAARKCLYVGHVATLARKVCAVLCCAALCYAML